MTPSAGVRFNHGVAVDLFKTVPGPLSELLALSERIAPVLAAGLSGNPRQCKRFLNMLVMRMQMAASRRVPLQQRALAKLMLLEYFKPEWFRRLAEMQAVESGKPRALMVLERELPSRVAGVPDVAGNGKERQGARKVKKGNGDQAEPLAGELLTWFTDTWMHDWLAMEPALSDTDLRPYFSVSRDILGPLGGAVRRMSPRAQEALNKLLHDSEAQRKLALKDAVNLNAADAAAVFESLSFRMAQEEDLSAGSSSLLRLFEWVTERGELRGQLITLLARIPEGLVPLSVPLKVVQVTKGTEAEASARQLLEQWKKSSNARLAKSAEQTLPRFS